MASVYVRVQRNEVTQQVGKVYFYFFDRCSL